jgi:hypothetical protein
MESDSVRVGVEAAVLAASDINRLLEGVRVECSSKGGTLEEWVVNHYRDSSPDSSPGFFVCVASKGVSLAVSLLFATLTAESTSVAAKEVRRESCWPESNFARPNDSEGVRGTAWRAPMIEGHERTMSQIQTYYSISILFVK